jgi:hypothetical protein
VLWGLTAAAAAGTTVLFFYTDFGWAREKRDEEDDVASRGRSFILGLRGSF